MKQSKAMESVAFDEFDSDGIAFAVSQINTIDVNKVAKREAYSNYLYPVLKRSFLSTVRIMSIVMKSVKKVKIFGMRFKVKRKEVDVSKLNEMENELVKVKLTVFTADNRSNRVFESVNGYLVNVFRVNGVKVKLKTLG